MLNNIPAEFKAFPNFVLYRHEERDGKPTKVPYSPHGERRASVSDPATWSGFDQCVSILPVSGADGIGFVLTRETDFVCIDLDPTDDPVEQARQRSISDAFDTYQEISPSGRGLHIWLRGSVPAGRRRGCVEMYHSGRFMTMTGNVYKDAPIAEGGELLQQLWAELGDTKLELGPEPSQEQNQSDEEVVEAASNAINGLKFNDLWLGEWQKYYRSQSEADYAIIDMFAYYTQSREQIIRLFHKSRLGQRPKAFREDYCEKMITKSFDHQLPPIDMEGLKESMARQLMELREARLVKPPEVTQEIEKPTRANPYTPPPGLIGELAQYIYAASPRPVPEIALAGALALMAGVCGRSYNISGTGLNHYIFLLAKTGVGKESMGNGISKILSSIAPNCIEVVKFQGPSRIASPEALIKYLSKTSNCFLSVMGEFAETLKRMSNDSRNPIQQGVKQMMLDLFNKSGKGAVLGSLIYSDKDKNTDQIIAPAFSILGEATPEKFYELLTDDMISEGLLPRFCIVEYQGERPPFNEKHLEAVFPISVKELFGAICSNALAMNNNNQVIDIQITPDAKEKFDEFDRKCDQLINEGVGAARELWNRGHIKALKLGGLLAIGTHYIKPTVSLDQALWAINLVENDIENMLKRFESGDVGSPQNQNKQLADLKRGISNYLTKSFDELKSALGATEASHKAKVIPHSYISAYCRTKVSFKADKQGPIQALKTILHSLIESGDLQEIGVKDKLGSNIALNGKYYALKCGLKQLRA